MALGTTLLCYISAFIPHLLVFDKLHGLLQCQVILLAPEDKDIILIKRGHRDHSLFTAGCLRLLS